MNNYLIPESIKELVSKLLSATSTNEKQNYALQIEAIRNFCNVALAKAATTPIKTKKRA